MPLDLQNKNYKCYYVVKKGGLGGVNNFVILLITIKPEE